MRRKGIKLKISKTRFRIVVSLLVILGGFIGWKVFFDKTMYSVNGNLLDDEIKFSDFYNEKYTEIPKLRIRSGKTGEVFETTDQGKIKEFIHIMNSTEFKKQKDHGYKLGWMYYVDLIESKDEKDWFRIGFNRVEFTRYKKLNVVKQSPYYDMKDSEKMIEKIGKFFQSLKGEK